jgi:hypothetical protein
MEGNITAGAVDARVIQTPHGFKVLPRDVFKRSGDEFTLLNNTGSTVHVSFPVLPTDPAQRDLVSGTTGVFRILNAAPGIYEYWVEIAVTDRARDFKLRASGGSDPQIIIDF